MAELILLAGWPVTDGKRGKVRPKWLKCNTGIINWNHTLIRDSTAISKAGKGLLIRICWQELVPSNKFGGGDCRWVWEILPDFPGRIFNSLGHLKTKSIKKRESDHFHPELCPWRTHLHFYSHSPTRVTSLTCFPVYPVVWSLLEKRFVLGSGKAIGDFCGGLQATQVPGEQG